MVQSFMERELRKFHRYPWKLQSREMPILQLFPYRGWALFCPYIISGSEKQKVSAEVRNNLLMLIREAIWQIDVWQSSKESAKVLLKKCSVVSLKHIVCIIVCIYCFYFCWNSLDFLIKKDTPVEVFSCKFRVVNSCSYKHCKS